MNMRIKTIWGVLGLVAVGSSLVAIGYFVGSNQTERRIYSMMEDTAVGQLASNLFMLDELEKGNTREVSRLLLASTGPQLDWIIDYGHLGLNEPDDRFRCQLIRKLKDYREKNKLFTEIAWENFWKVPGIKESEEKRIAFLLQTAPIVCPQNTK